MAEPFEEYLDYLRKNLTQLEQVGDSLSGADERIDYAVRQLLTSQGKINELAQLITELKEAGFVMPKQTQQINFRYTVPAGLGIRAEEQVPLDGIISSVCFHFPPGAEGWVQIAFGHGYKQIMPISGFLQLDDATPIFPASEVVSRNEIIWVVIQ
ncbi:unnamed protein product, partial [marine sediment metagenome]